MFIYPDFLMEFHCVGEECLNTCCAGWEIKLDEKTAEYYEYLDGEFGDFVRQNLRRDEISNQIIAIKLDEKQKCPFINEQGLCQIQLKCGAEHLGDICQNYPRHEHGSENISLLGVVTSCDAVMNLLYHRSRPVYLCTAGEGDSFTTEDEIVLELSHFISWGMECLQDESVPFGIALSTVLYVRMEIEVPFGENDFKTVDSIILQASEIQAQFCQVAQELDIEETEQAAWCFVLGILEVFCQTVTNRVRTYKMNTILWKPEMFEQSDDERKESFHTDWKKQKRDRKHENFMRRFAAVCFLQHALSPASEYVEDFCIRLIIAEILPLTWADAQTLSEKEYLSRLGILSRGFEQENELRKMLKQAIKERFSSDFYTYAVALMVLFNRI